MAALQTKTKLACLFIDTAVSGKHAVGPLTRFGAGTLLDRQIAALAAADIQEVAIWMDRAFAGMDTIITKWREVGLSITVLNTIDAMAQWAAASPSVLILAHNLLANSETLAHVAHVKEPSVFVRDAATSDERHERIDLNDRWTGMAVLPTRFLSELPELADDWSLQSALLRHAVQKGVRRESMAIGPAAPWQSEIAVDGGDVARWQSRMVDQHFDNELSKAAPFRRWIGLPFARMALPLLWGKGEEVSPLVTWARYALLVMAFILALLQWLPAALCLLIPLLLVEEVDRQYAALSPHQSEGAMAVAINDAAWFAFPIVGIMSVAGVSHFSAFLLGGVLASAIAVASIARQADEKWVLSRPESVVLALAFAIIGLSVSDSALLIALAALVSGFWRPIAVRLKAI